MTGKCMDCSHWREECTDIDEPAEALGRCGAITEMPYAWRWAWWEVVWTRGNEPPDDEPCSHFKHKE